MAEKIDIVEILKDKPNVVNNARFRRDSGWQCGGDRWSMKSISVPTEKEISDIKEENLRKALISIHIKVWEFRIHPVRYSCSEYAIFPYYRKV